MYKRGFTLIELLVVIAIVGILSSVVYTNLSGVREKARITAGVRFDSSTLHSIGDQLIGEWLFDTNASPTPDTSGFGNLGTLVGPPTWQQTGGYNSKGANSFDGSDYIDISSTQFNFERTDPFSISVWMKGIGTGQSIVGKMTNSAPFTGYDVELAGASNAGKITFFIINTYPTNTIAVTSKNTVNDGKWHHIVATYDGSSNASGAKIYVDGNLSVVTNVNNLSASIINGVDMHIGSRTGGEYFNGSIDDVRIYSSALAGSDVQKLYSYGISDHVTIK